MKKYVKPELLYERFVLSEQIAACKFDSNNTNQDVANCEFTGSDEENAIPNGTYFTEANIMCSAKFDAYCYHNGTVGANLFNS